MNLMGLQLLRITGKNKIEVTKILTKKNLAEGYLSPIPFFSFKIRFLKDAAIVNARLPLEQVKYEG